MPQTNLIEEKKCPKDYLTGEIDGLYWYNNSWFIDDGDTMNKCPKLS